ncbi:TPA: hypothetical protein ACXNGQ_003841, partial [Pseudomonas aeruginosa]
IDLQAHLQIIEKRASGPFFRFGGFHQPGIGQHLLVLSLVHQCWAAATDRLSLDPHNRALSMVRCHSAVEGHRQGPYSLGHRWPFPGCFARGWQEPAFPLSLEGKAKGAWSGSYPEVALKEARSRCVVPAN